MLKISDLQTLYPENYFFHRTKLEQLKIIFTCNNIFRYYEQRFGSRDVEFLVYFLNDVHKQIIKRWVFYPLIYGAMSYMVDSLASDGEDWTEKEIDEYVKQHEQSF